LKKTLEQYRDQHEAFQDQIAKISPTVDSTSNAITAKPDNSPTTLRDLAIQLSSSMGAILYNDALNKLKAREATGNENYGWKGAKRPKNEATAKKLIKTICDAVYHEDEVSLLDDLLDMAPKGINYADYCDLILGVGNEATVLYEVVRDTVGATDKSLNSAKERMAEANRFYDENPDRFDHIQKHHLNDRDIFSFGSSQTKRDFMRRLFKSFFTAQTGQKVSGNKLLELYNRFN
jgi:hypothetical protein